ncbi:putative PAS/PAC sensor protein [Methanoculleus bourgensis MS2]|uniref:histidine kinase n=1 Tax=Methanoculleus bourgensis (strain ATCC 43281 / DSM 3045 / OCM 15 / MS2) TaxID=1201294 RepID=I7LKL4_METBM|nr:PAS domain S-box protein [Methanoculleus bourgensis]CCJ37092.1 putative PAS/PAC sensor protein [Methanoculleus bourgensis MS2]
MHTMKESPHTKTPAPRDPDETGAIPPAVNESIPYGIWIAGPEGDVLHISDSFLDLIGMTIDECRQPEWLRLLHPEDMGPVLADRARCIASGECWNREFRVLGTDGEYHTIQSRGMPIRNDEGEVLLWAGVNLDGQQKLQPRAPGRERQARRMEALSRISGVIAQGEGNLHEICRQVVAWMPDGFRHPELISARIIIGRAVFITGDDNPRRIVAALPTERGVAGYLEVEYQGSLPQGTRDPFKPQERNFVHTVAVMIGNVIAREETKAALKSLERQHRLLSDQVLESIFLLETVRDSAGEPVDYRCIEINSRAEEEIGYGRDEVIGKMFFEFFPGTSPELRAMLCRVAKTGTPEHGEAHCRKLDGYYEVRAYRPQCNQLALIVNDITIQKKTEEALRESEEKYRMLVETARDGILVHDTRTFLYANPAAAALFGVERPEDLVGMSVIDRVHPDNRDQIRVRMSEVISGEIPPLRETQILRLDGSAVPVESAVSPVTYSGKKMVQITMRDITRRKRYEAALRRNGERFRRIFNQSPIGIEYYNLEGRLIYINRASLAIYGIPSRRDVIGYNLFRDPNTPAWARERFRRGDEMHCTTPVDLDLARRAGTYPTTRSGTIVIDVHASPVHDRKTGVLKGILMQLQDVTDRVRMEDQRQQAFYQIEQNIEQFAILADRIRLPLQVILGTADLIDDDEASAKIREQVERVNSIVRQLDKGWIESREIREFLRRNELV